MKTLFNIYFFCLLFLGIGANVLTSCKDDVESIPELSLERTEVQMKVGETVTVQIVGGSGNCQVAWSDEKLATAKIENQMIKVQALAAGSVTLTVTDGNGQQAVLRITIDKAEMSDKPRLVWTDKIALDEANGWGLTIFENKVAVTSCAEQTQYVLQWDGDSSEGKKEKASLTTLKMGKEPARVVLSGLEITDVKEGCYFITFSGENKSGELVFKK